MTIDEGHRIEIPMTEDQKFLFDLKGWIAIPKVLEPEEIEAIKNHLYTLRNKPESLPPHARNSYSGPCQMLLDHPAIVDILRQMTTPDVGPDAYGFRCDNSFWTIREAGWSTRQGPHNGGPNMGPTHEYRFRDGKMLSPATRVVWELNPVAHGDGGTLFMSGSHKGNYPIPACHMKIEDPLFEDYECPAGSVVIFSENICHASAPWTNQTHHRVVLFTHYMHYAMQFHKRTPPHEAIMAMPPKRRTLFRGVWMAEFPPGQMVLNDYYDEENRAL
ncbi:phytanoyl-CoA dioxygenase family protein [Candidatus Poribacteria bacterium]|nr:phytanoyl-CoA dioxygenase family protein [Candidatus Poribacteria bacterium]